MSSVPSLLCHLVLTQPQPLIVYMAAGTAVFFLFLVAAFLFCILYWAWAINRRRRQRVMAANLPYPSISIPQSHPHAQFGGDPVVRMEAGDNIDGLPKYSAQPKVDEQTVVRSFRPDWMSRPSVFRQGSDAPSRPPPAYDPSAPRQV